MKEETNYKNMSKIKIRWCFNPGLVDRRLPTSFLFINPTLKAPALVHSHLRGFKATSASLERGYSVLWGARSWRKGPVDQKPWSSPTAMGFVVLPGCWGGGVQ